MVADQRQRNTEPSSGLRNFGVTHWRLLAAVGVAMACVLVAGLIGFVLGSSAGDPSRQVTGTVEVVNDHAISLTNVDGVEDVRITAAFVADPALDIRAGDTVSGTYVEFDEPDRINTFIAEKVISRGS